jgi:hypothetical protein
LTRTGAAAAMVEFALDSVKIPMRRKMAAVIGMIDEDRIVASIICSGLDSRLLPHDLLH